MYVQIFFTPADLRAVTVSTYDIFIVIDVLRATTTLAVMFDRGVSRVFVANDLEQARAALQRYPQRKLCGERNMQPLPDSTYGNSPTQFARTDLVGQELILSTSNGTQAFYACPEKSICLAGSFYNGRALADYVLARALQEQRNISLVCSGKFDRFALDDTVCGGYLISTLQERFPVHLSARGGQFQAETLFLDETAATALALYEMYKPPRIIDCCDAAYHLIHAGQREDVFFCMQPDQSTSIPVVIGKEEETGLYMLQKI
jgi:2-phosphosulfolactate phosphatase